MNYPENLILKPPMFEFGNTKIKEICCHNSSEYLKFYGSDCTMINNFVNRSSHCQYSELFSLLPCSSLNLQENSKFCKLSGLDCIAQKSFLSVCSDIELKSVCDIKNLPCGDVVRLQL